MKLRRAAALTLIECVLGAVAQAQVAPAVVQAVAVDVVHALTLGRVLDEPVHVDHAAADTSLGVGPAVTGHQRAPFVVLEPLVVLGVHEGLAALGQGDVAEAAVRRVRRTFTDRRQPARAEVAADVVVEDLHQGARRPATVGTDQQARPGR